MHSLFRRRPMREASADLVRVSEFKELDRKREKGRENGGFQPPVFANVQYLDTVPLTREHVSTHHHQRSEEPMRLFPDNATGQAVPSIREVHQVNTSPR